MQSSYPGKERSKGRVISLSTLKVNFPIIDPRVFSKPWGSWVTFLWTPSPWDGAVGGCSIVHSWGFFSKCFRQLQGKRKRRDCKNSWVFFKCCCLWQDACGDVFLTLLWKGEICFEFVHSFCDNHNSDEENLSKSTFLGSQHLKKFPVIFCLKRRINEGIRGLLGK